MPNQTFKVGEMMHKRTRNTKTWMNFDGSYTTELHATDVHFADENGNLQNINTDLYDEADFDVVDTPVSAESVERYKQAKKESKTAKNKNVLNRADYGFQALRVPFDAHIPRNFKRGYSIGKGADKLTFKPVKASPSTGEPSGTDRSTIVYQDVWNDTDVELKVQPNGLKETLYLKTDRAPSTFRFEVKGKDIADDFTAGTLKLLPAWLEDAAGTYRDVEQKIVRQNDNKVYIELNADVTGLVYPIAIDPTVIINDPAGIDDAYMVTGGSALYNGSTMRVGLDPVSGSYQALIKFPLHLLPSTLSNVTSAQMNLYLSNYTEGAQELTINAHPITSSWSEAGSVIPTFNKDETLDSNFLGDSTLYIGKYHPWNVTSDINKILNGQKQNFGYLLDLRGFFGEQPRGYGTFNSSEANTNNPYLEVTYNEPPTRPIITAPNGGELWSAEHIITWQSSTDLEGDSIVYEVQLSTDNGSTWKALATNTTSNSLTYNFVSESESAQALVRVRAFDGTSYSEWDASNGVFTIEHNKAPMTPTNLTPKNGVSVDLTGVVRFDWKHNDSNTNDVQSEADINFRQQGETVWQTRTKNSRFQHFNFNSDTFSVGTYEWRVRTYDQRGLVSPWSNTEIFKAAEPTNAPEILTPGSTANVERPLIQWSATEQVAYRIILKNALGEEVWNTGEVASTVRTVTAGISLINGGIYTLSLQVKDNGGIFSDFDTQEFTVSYTRPPKPSLSVEGKGHYIALTLTNPEPTGTEPAILGNDVYKRASGGAQWKRIATGLNDTFSDYAVASGKRYEYKVQATGDNGTSRESDTAAAEIKFMGVYLHSVQDPSATSYHYRFDGSGRSSNKQVEHAFRQFAGRGKQTVEFGELLNYAVSASIQILREDDGAERLEEFVESRETVCYRDGRGRLLFGVITAAPLADVVYGWETTIDVTEIDYSEEV